MLNVEIISPAGVIFHGECLMAVVPSITGEIGVMQGHEAFIATLAQGTVKIYNDRQEITKEIEVTGGFAEISDDKKLVVLLDS